MISRFGKKGIGTLGIWIFVLIGTFTLGIVYLTISSPWELIYNVTTANMSAAHLATANKMNSVWNKWPLILMLALIVGGVIATLKKEPDSGYFG